MPAKHVIMGGKVHLYKRTRSKYWQCSTFLQGKNFRVSTKKTSLAEAEDIAEDWYLTLRGKSRAGELVTEKTFAEAAEQFWREYPVITQGDRNEIYVEMHRRRLDKYLIPYFGEMGLSQITPGVVQEYRIWRRENSLRGGPPARSTMHQEIVVLRQVLKTALRHGWLTHLPDLSMPYKSAGKITHRAWFSPEEYKQLYTATRRRIKARQGTRHLVSAQQLHDFVLFMANTGLRPDEARHLEHRDIQIVQDLDSDEIILEIEVRGKRGVGFCKSTTGAVKPYQRIVKRNNPKPTDLVFPQKNLYRDMFNNILKEEGLKHDRDGQQRTTYSLRHTYICLRLMEGADIYQIAKNCRTSVEMIEKYYAAHIKNTLDASAINVKRKRKLSKNVDIEEVT